MAVVDVAGRTVTLKIVYYGCALGGKTTNLISLHRLTDPDGRQGLVSIATNDDRTLFFDLLPMQLGQIGGMTIQVKAYTVPGQVHYELTRRQVLGGADGVVLVVDSSPATKKDNAWALQNLRYNLRSNGLDPERTPTVLQWNKRDLRDARPVEDLTAELNQRGLPAVEAVASKGDGVVETFAAVLEGAIAQAWSHSSSRNISPQQIAQTVSAALTQACSRASEAAAEPQPAQPVFNRRFDIDSYRDEQARHGRDRRIVDHDSLLSESVQTNMMLAEKLDTLREAENLGERRAEMMQVLARLAPMLADPSQAALPAGVMSLLLGGGRRRRGSLLLFRSDTPTMEEREIVPQGADPLNAVTPQGLGSVAHSLSKTNEVHLVEDLDREVFFGQPPETAAGLAGLLVAPLRCDGLDFGALFAYSEIREPAFDETEQEYWAAAATLVGLSLHWRALRHKLSRQRVS